MFFNGGNMRKSTSEQKLAFVQKKELGKLSPARKPEHASGPQVSWYGLDFLTVPEVAALRRCGISTVYHDVEAKRLKAYKIGGRLVFNRAEVIEWIQAHATIAASSEDGKGAHS
jgi:excisionase family DNA binding protein